MKQKFRKGEYWETGMLSDGNRLMYNIERVSQSAFLMAVWRYLERNKPEHKRIFDDEYASLFLSDGIIESYMRDILDSDKIYEGYFIPLLNSCLFRHSLIESIFKQNLVHRNLQVVIIATGFDTKILRYSCFNELKFFEIDRYDTIQYKKHCIKKTPKNVVYMTVDLFQDNLSEQLIISEYVPFQRSIFMCEGILAKLSSIAVEQLLRAIYNISYNSSVVIFDYIPKHILDKDRVLQDIFNASTLFVPTEEEIIALVKDIGYSVKEHVSQPQDDKNYIRFFNLMTLIKE